MTSQPLFIGRVDEQVLIKQCIEEQGNRYIIAINADGGIGKSRLLREIHDHYSDRKIKDLMITEIIDFDDPAFHIPRNVTRQLSEMLRRKYFDPYLSAEIEYRNMQLRGVARARLEKEREIVSATFVDCFNHLSSQKRPVLFFDTTDKLEGRKDIWQDLEVKFQKMNNFVALIAGRDAKKITKSLKLNFEDKESILFIDLEPFPTGDGKAYIDERCKQKNIPNIESDLIDKILLLTQGKPVLLDLAVEWRARGISLDWLEKSSVKDLQKLTKKQLSHRIKSVEKQLVSNINALQDPKDRLILLLSHVFPLDIEMIKTILPTANAAKLFGEAKEFVFVKSLPNNQISLHDVMRDMVNKHVWPDVDPDRRKRYSKKALEIYKKRLSALTQQLDIYEKEMASNHKSKAFEAALHYAEIEQQFWVHKEQHLRHALVVNINHGIECFIDAFDEATRQARLMLRKRLIDLLRKHKSKLSESQSCTLEYYIAKDLFDEGHFNKSDALCKSILENQAITNPIKVDTLILKGNAEIRLGNVGESIKDFTKAVQICESDEALQVQKIDAKNALGWAYRLTGNLREAQRYYGESKRLCMELGGPGKKELSNVYGLILNNYAFVLSNDNKTRKAAIDMANTAINHWKEIEDNIGLGAGYLVLGIAYYRSDLSDLALEAFQKSLDIFEPLGMNDWIGQIFSWRGAQYQDIQQHDLAKDDFDISLKISAKNIEAMTLNRLARVYMNKLKWSKAEKLMTKSLDAAKKTPDYIYWIGSIARLISISAKKYLKDKKKLQAAFDKYTQEIKDFESKFEKPDENSLGIAYLGLAKILFLLNDAQKKTEILRYLEQGIPFIVEFGSYARTDIQTRLAIIEEDFRRTDSEIIRTIGKEMLNFIYEREAKNLNYSTAVDILFKWAHWNEEEN